MTQTRIEDYQIDPGTANQLLGTNAAGTVDEYKTLSGTSNQITVTHGAGSITLSTPQDININSNVNFQQVILSGSVSTPLIVSPSGNDLTLTPATGHVIQSSKSIAMNSNKITGLAAATTSGDALSWGNALDGTSLVLQNQGAVTFDDTGSHSVAIEAPTTITSSYTLKLPIAQASGTQFLQNDGSGNLSWGTVTSGVSSVNTFTGAITIQGSTNEININNSSGTITISTPQAIDSTAAPQFAGLTITGAITATNQTITVKNVVITGVTSDPVSPVEGQFWYRSDTHQWVGYDGSVNVILG